MRSVTGSRPRGSRSGRGFSALAGAGEVLTSNTVKDLVTGSGIVFEPRGPHQLKGIADEWMVYAAIG